MQTASEDVRSNGREGACPYLGLRDDPETHLLLASHANYCHRATPPAPVRRQHQIQYCQSPQHVECEVFRRQKPGRLPPSIQAPRDRTTQERRPGLLVPLLLVLLVAIAGLAWFGTSNGMLGLLGGQGSGGAPPSSGISPTAPAYASPAVPSATIAPVLPGLAPTEPPLPTAILTIQPTYFDPSADTATPVSTAEGFCAHELDTPFGPGNKLLIHKLGGGDSLNRFEIVYHTSVKAIEGINLEFRIPVPRNTVLVIPLDTTEVGSLPIFEPILASERNISIQTMAFKVKADLQAFEMYNGFNDQCRDFVGWVVAPRERPAP